METNFGASQNSGAMSPSVSVKTPLVMEIGKGEGERRKIEGCHIWRSADLSLH